MELCSENSSVTMMSPRISFSHDLTQSDTALSDQYLLRSISSSSVDFDFCVHHTSDQQSSSADELFSGGKLLPIQVKKKNISPISPKPNEIPSPNKDAKPSKSSKSETKSFWRFKRSSSLNCGGGYARSLCPLPPLSRSNSAGSASSSVKPKDGVNQKHKTHMNNCSSSGYQKPPLKKSGGGGYGNVSVLNVPPANMFGLGSFFSTNKDKNKKK